MARTRSADEETRRLAFDTLIEAYWKPVYKYLRLKWNLGADEAADATQEFFTGALQKEMVERFDPERARFRTYLRLCVDGFAANRKKAEQRIKRGGSIALLPLDFGLAEGELARYEPAAPADVDDVFYREWVRALLERAVADLRAGAEQAGRPEMFEVFARYDLIEDEDKARPTYAELAASLGLTTTTVTNHLAAMRKRFRQVVLNRLRDFTSSDEEWEAEAMRLLGRRG